MSPAAEAEDAGESKPAEAAEEEAAEEEAPVPKSGKAAKAVDGRFIPLHRVLGGTEMSSLLELGLEVLDWRHLLGTTALVTPLYLF